MNSIEPQKNSITTYPTLRFYLSIYIKYYIIYTFPLLNKYHLFLKHIKKRHPIFYNLNYNIIIYIVKGYHLIVNFIEKKFIRLMGNT